MSKKSIKENKTKTKYIGSNSKLNSYRVLDALN